LLKAWAGAAAGPTATAQSASRESEVHLVRAQLRAAARAAGLEARDGANHRAQEDHRARRRADEGAQRVAEIEAAADRPGGCGQKRSRTGR